VQRLLGAPSVVLRHLGLVPDGRDRRGRSVAADGAGAGIGDPLWAGAVIGEGRGDTAAVDVGDGAGEPAGPASVVANCKDGEVVDDAEPDIEEPPGLGKDLAGGTDCAPGFGGGGSDAPPAGADARVEGDGVSVTKTGKAVGESP
jgi:hypothetical protein